MTMDAKIRELEEKRAALMLGGGNDRIEKQHKAGKLSARERVEALVDPGTFQESGLFARHRATVFGMADKELPADGVVTGCAAVGGRLVHLASQDFTVGGGAAGEVHSTKIADTMEMSLKTGSPFIFINDSGGARVQEGIDSLSGYGKVFYTNTKLSGAVPQISLICGPCAGGAAYSPALTDFIIQTRQAQMFITGPQVIKQVTGEVVTAEQLGGADAHMTHSGVIHLVAQDDHDAVFLCRRLLSFMPNNNLEDPPALPTDGNVDPNPELKEVVPVEGKHAYDVRKVIMGVVDAADFLEIQPGFAWPDGAWALSPWLGDSAVRIAAASLFALIAAAFIVAGTALAFRQAWWQSVAVTAAVASTLALILLWNGRPQALDAQGAYAVLINAAVLVVVLLFHWPRLGTGA
jgi:methylmalonyl-CoA carboxyltransferase large subunit